MGWMNSLLSVNKKTEINVFYSKLSSVKNYSINHSVIRLYEPIPNVRKSHIPKQLNRKKQQNWKHCIYMVALKNIRYFQNQCCFVVFEQKYLSKRDK